MADYSIRRNKPYPGMVMIYKVRSGAFVAQGFPLPERVFIALAMEYLDGLTPAESAKFRQRKPERPAAPPSPPPSTEARPAFRVRKPAEAAAAS